MFYFRLYHAVLAWIMGKLSYHTTQHTARGGFGKFFTKFGPTADFVDLILRIFIGGNERRFIFFQSSSFLKSRLYVVNTSEIKATQQLKMYMVGNLEIPNHCLIAEAHRALTPLQINQYESIKKMLVVPDRFLTAFGDYIDTMFVSCFVQRHKRNLDLTALEAMLVKQCFTFTDNRYRDNRGQVIRGHLNVVKSARYIEDAHSIRMRTDPKYPYLLGSLFTSNESLKTHAKKAKDQAIRNLTASGQKITLQGNRKRNTFILREWEKIKMAFRPTDAEERSIQRLVGQGKLEGALHLGLIALTCHIYLTARIVFLENLKRSVREVEAGNFSFHRKHLTDPDFPKRDLLWIAQGTVRRYLNPHEEKSSVDPSGPVSSPSGVARLPETPGEQNVPPSSGRGRHSGRGRQCQHTGELLVPHSGPVSSPPSVAHLRQNGQEPGGIRTSNRRHQGGSSRHSSARSQRSRATSQRQSSNRAESRVRASSAFQGNSSISQRRNLVSTNAASTTPIPLSTQRQRPSLHSRRSNGSTPMSQTAGNSRGNEDQGNVEEDLGGFDLNLEEDVDFNEGDVSFLETPPSRLRDHMLDPGAAVAVSSRQRRERLTHGTGRQQLFTPSSRASGKRQRDSPASSGRYSKSAKVEYPTRNGRVLRLDGTEPTPDERRIFRMDPPDDDTEPTERESRNFGRRPWRGGRKKNQYWTREETKEFHNLVKGHGESQWVEFKEMKALGEKFIPRTNVQLKDKYRNMIKRGWNFTNDFEAELDRVGMKFAEPEILTHWQEDEDQRSLSTLGLNSPE